MCLKGDSGKPDEVTERPLSKSKGQKLYFCLKTNENSSEHEVKIENL